MKSKNNSILLIAIGFVFIWNSGFIGAEYGLPYTRPFTLLFWRYWALTLILLLYLSVRGRLQWPGFSTTMLTFFIGILAHGVWQGCVFFSLQYGVPAGIVALVVALQPMTTGALSGIVVSEPTPLHRWIGLLIGFFGVAIAVFARIDCSDIQSVFYYLIPFGSVIAMTVASLLQRRQEVYSQSQPLPVDLTLFYQSLATAVVVSIPAITLEHLATRWNPIFVGTMLWLILGLSLVAYALMWQLIARMDATRVASLFYLGPPVTMLMAWAVFGDRLLISDTIALVIVACGVFLTQIEIGRSTCQANT